MPALVETPEAATAGSLRQRMEQHRTNAQCATCHARMDPIGFGLENYDAVGVWRTDGGGRADRRVGHGGGPVVCRTGRIQAAIAIKPAQFTRCLAENC